MLAADHYSSEQRCLCLTALLLLLLLLQYTFILPASKNLPSQMVDFYKGTTKHRKSVGVRVPDNSICQVGGHQWIGNRLCQPGYMPVLHVCYMLNNLLPLLIS